MSLRNGTGVVLATVLGLTTLWGFADEEKDGHEKIEATVKIPAKILEAIKAKWPKAEIEAVEVEEEDGKIIFEFELEEDDGKTEKEWSATFSADGKLLEIEEEVKLADVPKAVLEALQKKYPAVKKPQVEKLTEGEGAAAKTSYELKFALEVKIDSTGKVLAEEEIELDEGEDEDDDDDDKNGDQDE